MADIISRSMSKKNEKQINDLNQTVVQKADKSELTNKADKTQVDTLSQNVTTVTEQLAEKAQQTYVETMLAAAVSGAPKGFYNTLNALQVAYPQGTDGVFLILENGHIYIWNGTQWADAGVYQGIEVGDRTVSENKTTFMTSRYNMYNSNSIESGYFYSKSGTKITKSAGTNVATHPKIKLKANTKYTITEQKSSFWFVGDESMNFIAQLSLGNSGGTYTTTQDCYLYPTINTSLSHNTLMIVEGDKPPKFYAYGVVFERDIPNLKSYATKEEAKVVSYTRKVVAKDGSGDFTTIAAAVASFSDGTYYNRNMIVIKPGIYTEKGIYLPDFLELVNENGKREDVHIKGELPDSATDSEITPLSTLDLKKSNRLKNITITAKNMRYAIHCESNGQFKDWEQILENCHIEHYGNQGARDYRTANGGDPNAVWSSSNAWGEGGSSGSYARFDKCRFVAHDPNAVAWSTHNNTNFEKPMIRELNNCEIISKKYGSIRAEGLVSGTADKIFVNNCFIDGNVYCTNALSIEVVIGGSTHVGSNTTSYFDKNSTAYYTEFTKRLLNNTGATISKGTLVCFDTSDKRIRPMLSSDSARLFAGFTIGDTEPGEFATVISNGFYRYTTNLTFGVEYGVDNGLLSSTATNKIGMSVGNGFVKVKNPFVV